MVLFLNQKLEMYVNDEGKILSSAFFRFQCASDYILISFLIVVKFNLITIQKLINLI